MKAPSLSGLTMVQGEAPSLDAIANSGNVLIVECWATWCPPCVKSIPHLSQLQAKYQDQGLVVLGISQEDPGTIRSFVERMGIKMSYRVASGNAGEAYMRAFNATGIPCAFIVNPANEIVWNGHPMQPQFEQAIEEALNDAAKVQKKNVAKGKTKEEIEQMGVRQLKTVLAYNGVDYSQVNEKHELVELVLKHCV